MINVKRKSDFVEDGKNKISLIFTSSKSILKSENQTYD